ncbi:legumain-like [Macrobrachium rosenbergii]|uniref:legumain n=2 Tax=cellular organisms TaxID=131567 RepID=A0A342CJ47_MACRS|nr:legumain-like protein [Macrobrachium rosenbergii]
MKLAALLALLPLVAAAGIPPENEGVNWAVLVAGSSGWFNYRHQSDICHAYQIMHDRGIPDERIIVMIYDDIADNSENPYPGQIFNHPEGSDVYAGVPKDYTGTEITPELFLAVLQGNEQAVQGVGSGKVVKSGPNDRIFVNLDDHGAVGLFAFPWGELMADEFAAVVTSMHDEGKYKEIMIYIEACESGSMFEDLYPASLKAYGLSASSPSESSWATYCDNPYGVCLGDEFSVNWMEDTEANDPTTETLKTQFENTEKLTLGSQVMQWGDTSIDAQVVATFFGPTSSAPKKYSTKRTQETSIPVQDVPLVMLERKLKSATNELDKKTKAKEIAALKERREFVHTTMKNIALSVTGDEKLIEEMMVKKNTKITNWSCYNPVVHAFSENCFNLGQSTYALTTVHTLLHLCEAGYSTSDIINSMKSVCYFPTIENAF